MNKIPIPVQVFMAAIMGAMIYGAWPILTHPLVGIMMVAITLFGLILGTAFAVGLTLNWLSHFWYSNLERRVGLEKSIAVVQAMRAALSFDCGIDSITEEGVRYHNPFPSMKSMPQGQLPELPEPEAPRESLIDSLSHCDSILFVGARRRGKTTNMMRVMEARAHKEKAVVFDTHANPSKWAGAAWVIGSEIDITEEERFNGMWRKMQSLIKEKNDRLDKFRRGEVEEGCFEPTITIYIDEFTHIPIKLKEYGYSLKEFTGEILTEGAKTNFSFVWGVHSFRKNALGLEGSMDLTECFDAIVHLVKEKGQFYSEVSWDGNKNTDGLIYEPAPPYPLSITPKSDDGFAPNSNLGFDLDNIEVKAETETEIIDLSEPEIKPEPELDDKGWPIVEQGTIKEKMMVFAKYMIIMGIDVRSLTAANVLDHIQVSRNGENYRKWTSVAEEAWSCADDDAIRADQTESVEIKSSPA